MNPVALEFNNWTVRAFFLNGFQQVESGDIFIVINNDAEYSLSNTGGSYHNDTVQNTLGYDYVIDLDFNNMRYSVYELNEDSSTVLVYYSITQKANPWRDDTGDTNLDEFNDNIIYFLGLPDWEGTDLLGISHNAVSVDIGFLGGLDYEDFIVPSTLGCGNDNLMGGITAHAP